MTDQLKNTNQCIVAALAAVASAAGGLDRLLGDNRQRIRALLRVARENGGMLPRPRNGVVTISTGEKPEEAAAAKEIQERLEVLEEELKISKEDKVSRLDVSDSSS